MGFFLLFYCFVLIMTIINDNEDDSDNDHNV